MNAIEESVALAANQGKLAMPRRRVAKLKLKKSHRPSATATPPPRAKRPAPRSDRNKASANGGQALVDRLRECQGQIRRQLDELRMRGNQLSGGNLFHERLFDEGPIPYAVVDAAGMIRELNMPAAELLGVAGRDVTGEPLATYLEAGSPADFYERLGDSATSWELVISGGDRQPIPVLAIARRIPKGYSAGCVRLALLDISDRKRTEAGLREAAERLAAANLALASQAEQLRQMSSQLTHAEQRERGRIADLIHDHIQQLLVACRMGLDVMISRKPELAQHGQELVQILQDAISALRSLTAELRPPALREQGLCAAMGWLGNWMKGRYGLDVHVETDPDCEGMPDDLQEILYHGVRELLFNVTKHAGVTEAELDVALDRKQDQCVITVSDRGSGFDSADWMARGDGTGLSNIQDRLQAVGAKLEVQSRPGEGTFAVIRAPRDPKPPEFEPPPVVRGRRPQKTQTPGRKKIRVLIADDHALVRQGISALLRLDEGIDVIGEAQDGRAAIEAVAEHTPDVVLMDVNMPEVNGVEATRQIKADFPHVHVVGLSMHTERAMADAMREAGAEGYISKDAPSDELLAAIRKQVHARGGGTNRG